MSQSLAQVYLHLVFSTKNRIAFLNDDIRSDLHSYMAGILRDLGSNTIIINTEPDHAHVLCMLPRTVTLATLLGELKRGSSLWIKTKNQRFVDFHWQNGYGAFSVSASKLEVVKRYIQNQREHHQRESFQDEFRRWLREYEMDFDERYVWD
jgi:REP element-mobilizing transposase RayT